MLVVDIQLYKIVSWGVTEILSMIAVGERDKGKRRFIIYCCHRLFLILRAASGEARRVFNFINMYIEGDVFWLY